MGSTRATSEDDKALVLCQERKRYVKEALEGRCALATAHFAYIQSLRHAGFALRKFVEPEVPTDSSLYTSTSATPEPPGMRHRSMNLSPSVSHPASDSFSPAPSPLSSGRFHVNHMKAGRNPARTVEEKVPVPVTATLETSSSVPIQTVHDLDDSSTFEAPPGTPPWDYFGLFQPVESQLSFHDEKESGHDFENADDIRRLREKEGIPELEEELEKSHAHAGDVRLSQQEKTPDVRDGEQSTMSGREDDFADSEDDFENPSSEPLVRMFKNRNDTPVENIVTDKSPAHPAADKASDSGKEVPRMLEADKVNFRPLLPEERARVLKAPGFFAAFFACCREDVPVPQPPPQADGKYLTWHRSVSSHSSSSRNPLGAASKVDVDGLTGNIFSGVYMNSGSHASTLDRLYAWERKLCDEVKASSTICRQYDEKCRYLRNQESRGENQLSIDRTRAVVKDLYSRILVAIQRIDMISKNIEDLRDKELQPQLEELIGSLTRMWETMLECHRHQHEIIKLVSNSGGIKVLIRSESQFQATLLLQWIKLLKELPIEDLEGGIKGLIADINHCVPRQEKRRGGSRSTFSLPNGGLSDEMRGVHRKDAHMDLQSSLESFLGKLEFFSDVSVHKYGELKDKINAAKEKYEKYNK
ncbi:hypothetical protein ZWY2020_029388 [Hordeum vulgare]|nr:hypothetical protein ZWY2020_029388 [Hordeum vulgare]